MTFLAAGVPDHSGGSAPGFHRLPITSTFERRDRTVAVNLAAVTVALPLRARIEAGIARGLASLSPRALRRLLGPPIVIDGQQLGQEVQLILKLLERSGAASIEQMSVDDARAQIRADAASFAGQSFELARVEELTVAGSDPRAAVRSVRYRRAGPTTHLLPWWRIRRRRPRYARQQLPVPRSSGRRTGAGGRLPARA